MQKMLETSKQTLLDEAAKAGNSKTHFSSVRALASGAAPKGWSVEELLPDLPDMDAGNPAAD